MYGKLFAQMYDGTLGTRGPWEALITFQQLVILADKYGVIDMTPEAIARRTTIPIEIITRGITALEAEDPESRSPAENGRRIVRLSDARAWGWRLVNYAHYRALRSEEDRREYHRIYARKRRASTKTSTNVNTSTERQQNQPIAVSSKQYAVSKQITARRGRGARKVGGGRTTKASTPPKAPADWLLPAQEAWEAKNGRGSFRSAKAAKALAQLHAAGWPAEKVGVHLACFLSKVDPIYHPTIERFAASFDRWDPAAPPTGNGTVRQTSPLADAAAAAAHAAHKQESESAMLAGLDRRAAAHGMSA